MDEPPNLPSITAKAAALAVACGNTVQIINAAIQRYQGPDLIISSIAQELASVQCIWDSVQSMLCQRISNGCVSHELLVQLDRTIWQGRHTVQSLDEDLSWCVKLSANNGDYGFRQRTRIIWNQRRWRSHQDRIRGQMLMMNLLVSTLGMSNRCHHSLHPYDETQMMLGSSPSGAAFVSDTCAHAVELDGMLFHEMSANKSGPVAELRDYRESDSSPSERILRQQWSQQPSPPERASNSNDNATSLNQSSATEKSSDHPQVEINTVDQSKLHNDRQSSTTIRPDGPENSTADTSANAAWQSRVQSETVLREVSARISNPWVTSSHGQLFNGNQELTYMTCVEMFHAARTKHELESILLYACQHGAVEIVEQLLGLGTDVHTHVKQANAASLGPSALGIAVMHGGTEVTLTLLRHGSRPNDVEEGGRTPLHHAVYKGDLKMVELLLQYGARPYLADHDGIEPLHIACQLGSLKIARLLLGAGASLEASDKNGDRPVHYLVRHCKDPHFAAFLVGLGCDLRTKNEQALTPLQLACVCGNDRVLEILLHHDVCTELEEWSATPLALAISGGYLATARILLQQGAQADRPCPTTQKTLLHLAAETADGYAKGGKSVGSHFVRLLCEYGAAVNAQDVKGDTPLHVALSRPPSSPTVSHKLLMVKCLLSHGARTDKSNLQGVYPLSLAPLHADLPTFQLVLAASMERLSVKHLARIDREMRKRKASADHPRLKEMSSLLSTALILRATEAF